MKKLIQSYIDYTRNIEKKAPIHDIVFASMCFVVFIANIALGNISIGLMIAFPIIIGMSVIDFIIKVREQ
jgi:hypothetical protein